MTDDNTVASAVEAGTAPGGDKSETPTKTDATEAAQGAAAPVQEQAEAEIKAEDDAASEAGRALAERKRTARERVQQAVARQREAERQSAEKDKVIADLQAKLKKPDPASYDDNAQYTADVVEHRLNERDLQKLQREKEGADRAQREAVADVWSTRLSDYRQANPEFEKTAFTAPISEATALLIAEMEDGPAVSHKLDLNHAEAQRIDRLPDRQKAIELGKLSARLSATPTKKITQAPAPVKAVGGGPSHQKDPSEMTFKEFKAFREKGAK